MTSDPEKPALPNRDDIRAGAKFDVEHALGMYALSFCVLPAEGIYDDDILRQLGSTVDSCHIYLIGYTPRIEFVESELKGRNLNLAFEILGKRHVLSFRIPEGLSLKREAECSYLEDSSGRRCWPNEQEIQQRLNQTSKAVTFEVKYVGQAYGQDGSRGAIDRLLKHETLQKISLKGVPEGHRLTLLLLAIQPNNQLFTVMNPFAEKRDESGKRIKAGLDKLHNTTEIERISLYEAALIRYFYPDFNKEFKDSFPSTNLKILQDCYKKDFSAVIAEICIDELPFQLCSGVVKPAFYHIAKHDLHGDKDRRAFFGL